MAGVPEALRLILVSALSASHVEIIDQSGLHAGHAGSKATGGGHYQIVVVSEAFEGKSLLERHRLINDAVFSALPGQVHALAVKALTQKEWAVRKTLS